MFTWLSKQVKPGIGKKVFVGVSGGVDSSVTLALLQDQGYDVVGVFIRTWQPDFIECTWRDERRDAMRVCAHLRVPFVELDLEREYKEGVADYMIAEYRKGRTPNPDVMCNREVKFGGFLTWALAQGADYVATGHYAQNNNGELIKGIDQSKDQSYFLWTLTQDQLKHILFPVGGLPKSTVRKLAQKYRLPTAVKKDSQGVCFIGEIDMKEFLKHYIGSNKGFVANEHGDIIGEHEGVLLYTLGERHGFTITKKTTSDKPYYVIAKDIQSNTLVVSQNPQSGTIDSQVRLEQCVWRTRPDSRQYTVQIRYHGALKEVHMSHVTDMGAVVHFIESDFSLAPGQSVVVFDGEVCIGGGIVA
jgi:tRNA-specific 2-thiouridylase